MIVAERRPRVAERAGEPREHRVPDGRLTAPSDGTVYRLREAAAEARRLGRELTEAEMRRFVV